MTTVTGYLLTTDTGGVGPTVGDVFAPGSTLDFDRDTYTAEYSGILNYPTTFGDVQGVFYFIGGFWYFVPTEPFGAAPTEAATATTVNSAIYGTSSNESIVAPDDSGWVIYGGADTSPIGTGKDSITGGAGADTIYAGDGNDRVIFGAGDNVVYGGAGFDFIDDIGGSQLTGNDYIDGGADADTVYAGGGGDTIIGGTGNDQLYGEDDADTFILDDTSGSDTIQGGEGVSTGTDWDTIDASAVTLNLTVLYSGDGSGTISTASWSTDFYDIEQLILGSGNDFVDAAADGLGVTIYAMDGDDHVEGSTGNDILYGGTGVDELWGDAGNDLIYGEEGDDDLGGNTGDDTIYGGDGDDWIQGNAGADLLDGGAGDDTFEVFTTQAGSDTIIGGETDQLSGDTIVFTGADAVSVLFSANETGTFTAGVASGSFSEIERFVGGTGTADVLDATSSSTGVTAFNITGFETIWGSAYDDTFNWMNTTTGVYAAVNGGADSVQGGSGNDTIYGGDGDDTIWASFGNDTLTGDAGDDYLYGGYGNDTIYGGIGDDTIGVGRNDDLAYGEDGSDTFFFEHDMGTNTVYGGNGGSDIDMLDFDRLFDSPVNVTWSTDENGTATDPYGSVSFFEMEGAIGSDFDDVLDASIATTSKYLYGGAGNDIIAGGDGDDTISGGTGDDTMVGWDGADTFLVEDGFGTDSIIGGDAAGATTNFDTIDLRAVTANLTVTFSGDGAGTITDGTNTITFSGIERIFLGEGDDTFDSSADGTGIEVHGWSGADDITTGDGADHIASGDGDDTIRSGAGSDTVWGDAGSDTIVVADDDTGTDTIYGSDEGGDTDALLFENVSGTSGATITYAGWEYGSYSFGTATGDFWEIEQVTATAYDDVIDASASGSDHVLEGLAGNDTITGGMGADQLAGGDGDDRLDGGAGDDTYVLGDGFGIDVFTGGETGETAGDTIDASGILAGAVSVAWTDAATGVLTVNTNTLTFSEVESYTLTQYGDSFDASLSGDAVDVDGGAGDDMLTGSVGADTLSGGAGDDDLWGGAGADLLDGGDGDDAFHLEEGFGDDTIVGGETGELAGDTILATGMTTPLTVVFDSNDAGTISDGSSTLAFSGIERVLTGEGADSVDLSGDTDGVFLFTDDGNDTVISGQGDDTINTGNNGDTIYVTETSGTDTIAAGNATDSIFFTDSTTGQGVTVTYTGASAASYSFDGTSAGGTYTSVENVTTTDNADTIDTTALSAGDATDVHAGAGDDTYVGGAGDDTFFGDDGDDTYTIADGFGTDDFHGGETSETAGDTLDASAVTAGLSVIYTDGEDATLTDGTNTVTFVETENVVLGTGDDTIDGSAAVEAMGVAAGDGADQITGGAGADTLDGGAGNDAIDAGAGDDTLTGGTGDDTLTGGAGDDTFTYAPGDGADTITDWNAGNTATLGDGDSTNNDFIDLSAFYDDIWELHADQADDGVLNQSNDGVDGVDYSDNTQFQPGDSLTFTSASADNSSFTSENTGIVCFARGTRILTPQGEVPIERLRAGDSVVTADRGVRTIRWIGSRRVPRSPNLQPIRIAAGALGAGLPRRTLYVSPQHRLLLRSRLVARMTGAREVLVPAKTLTGMRGIHPDARAGHVRYFHILCDTHEIVFADGAPAETLLPGPMARVAMGPETWAELVAIFPDIDATLDHALPARAIVKGKRRGHLLRRHRRNGIPLLERQD